ncbi:MAG: DNA methyltransferase, partial [Phycisphaerales bacterium]|nr:DNA methyltransferase [Phycisphaerales bacterium]
QRTGHVVGGHQRLAVMVELGHTSAEVVVVHLTPAREKALNLALNKIQGGWDEPKLAALLAELGQIPDLDLSLTGFGEDEVSALLATLPGAGGNHGDDADFDHDSAFKPQAPAVTKLGDVLVLGKHRLLCGDCTDTASVRKVMNGQKAVLFATDPPYLVGYDGTNHPGKGQRKGKKLPAGAPPKPSTKNKDWSATYGVTWDDADANPELYDRFIAAAVAEALQPKAAWYCWHASRRQSLLEAAWTKHGAFVHCQIIWVKNRPVLTRSDYAWQHEPCFYGWVQGKRPPRAPGKMRSTVWPIDTLANGPARPDHPTPKPLEVFEIPIEQHTKPGEVCYEPFAGSGTQLIAAERQGRRCFALEVSPHYCDLIVRRWIHQVGPANAPHSLVARYALAAPAKPVVKTKGVAAGRAVQRKKVPA